MFPHRSTKFKESSSQKDILADEISEVQKILRRVELETAQVALYLNADKTGIVVFNDDDSGSLITAKCDTVYYVKYLHYLGDWVENCEKYIHVRKSLVVHFARRITSRYQGSLDISRTG